MSTLGLGLSVLLSWWERVGSLLFRRFGGAVCPLGAVPASQFASGPSGGQGSGGACRDDRRCRGSRLEGFVAGEYVPAGDQDLAGDGGFGGVAVSLPAADVDVQSVPGVLWPPALLGRLDRRPTVRAASPPSTAV